MMETRVHKMKWWRNDGDPFEMKRILGLNPSSSLLSFPLIIRIIIPSKRMAIRWNAHQFPTMRVYTLSLSDVVKRKNPFPFCLCEPSHHITSQTYAHIHVRTIHSLRYLLPLVGVPFRVLGGCVECSACSLSVKTVPESYHPMMMLDQMDRAFLMEIVASNRSKP